MGNQAGGQPTPVRIISTAALSVALLLCATSSFGAQTFRGKNLYFGDLHWHTCLAGHATATPTGQYESMFHDYGLDFSMASEHAEGAEEGVSGCGTYLPPLPPPFDYTGEQIANAMKAAADDWTGELDTLTGGKRKFVAFPGYEWAPDARCWNLTLGNLSPRDTNAGNNGTPGHINYFFSDTTGWTYKDDVWAPGDGPSTVCAIASLSPWLYYNGSKDWNDEILGQLIHQRDDPDRDYDLLIQYNHPAASMDKGGSSDHLAKWFDFEHSATQCSVEPDAGYCAQSQCEAGRRAYGVSTVEWYAKHEAAIGSTEQTHQLDCSVYASIGAAAVQACIAQELLFHPNGHQPGDYVASRGLREGIRLGAVGGSDSHNGRWNDPTGFPTGDRGAGARSLTVVYAADATRPAIWDGVANRRTYTLSRLREIGPVHKGRVDFYSAEATGLEVGGGAVALALPPGDGTGLGTVETGMGEMLQALAVGTTRAFTISAATEEDPATGQPVTGVYPVELRLYRVGPDTPLSAKTDSTIYWLDDLANDPGKFGELVGKHVNPNGATALTHTFPGVVVHPGDAFFAVVPYSDYVWTDTYYADGGEPLDADKNGEIDSGKSPALHGDNNTWARTSPIFFYARNEAPASTPACTTVAFNGSGSSTPLAAGGGDLGVTGDDGVLPVAFAGGYDREWNRWRFTLPADAQYVDLSFFTAKDEDNVGHVFAVRIDGRLVYSGRAGLDHPADELVDMKNIPFPLKKGLHQVEVHMDDQEYANGDNEPDFHCNDYDGPPGFLDSIAFHATVSASCTDVTPPVITCPTDLVRECSAPGGTPATDTTVAAFLAGATATDDIDPAPVITSDAPTLFPTGATVVTFTARDASGNAASCSAQVTVADTTAPQLSAFSLTPSKLFPPNHKLVNIAVPTLTATDTCDAAPAIRCSVGSSESPNTSGDGNTAVDIVFNGESISTQGTGERLISTIAGKGSFSLKLRAERDGRMNGRTYTANCAAVDATGNRGATKAATVVVPK